MEIVVYDEIEKFRRYDHPEFQYPFEKRKNTLEEFSFSLDVPDDGNNYDYLYKDDKLQFRISQVCLEAPYYSQINIFGQIYNKGGEVWNKMIGNEQNTAISDEFECNYQYFEKIKFEKQKSYITNYNEVYERGLITDRILYQIQLAQDQFKTISERQSTQLLDYVGDLGGFYQAIDILIFAIGEYFAAKFFIQSIS